MSKIGSAYKVSIDTLTNMFLNKFSLEEADKQRIYEVILKISETIVGGGKLKLQLAEVILKGYGVTSQAMIDFLREYISDENIDAFNKLEIELIREYKESVNNSSIPEKEKITLQSEHLKWQMKNTNEKICLNIIKAAITFVGTIGILTVVGDKVNEFTDDQKTRRFKARCQGKKNRD